MNVKLRNKQIVDKFSKVVNEQQLNGEILRKIWEIERANWNLQLP